MPDAGYELSQSQVGAFDRGAPPVTVRVPGTPGADLGAALAAAVERWEILRTTFPVLPGAVHPLQVIAESTDPVGPRRSGADLSTLPLLEVATDDGGLRLTAPAVVADHRSLELLGSWLAGHAAAPEDPVQFVDIAGWEDEQRATDGPERRAAEAFWSGSDIAATVPEDAAAGGMSPETAPLVTDHDIAPEGWLAGWLAVLQRHGLVDDGDVTLAVTVSGRSAPELVDAVGPLARWVPVVVPVAPELSFTAATDSARAVLGRAERYAVFAPPVASAAVGVSFHPASAVDPHPHPGVSLELQVTGGTARVVTRGGVSAARLTGHLGRLLDTVTVDPSVAVGEVGLLGADELAELARVQDGGPTPTSGPDPTSLVAAFRAQVAGRPDATAVLDATAQLTFAELAGRADALAGALRARPGWADGDAVGVVVERTVETVVALTGVLAAGGCFQPLDAVSPGARLAAQLEQGRCGLVVAPPGWVPPDLTVPVVTAAELVAAAPGVVTAPTSPDGEAVAYQMSTSGTTGTPKVVAVRHRNAVGYTRGVVARLGLTSADRLGVVTSLSTDLAYTMLLPLFVVGASVRLFNEDEIGELAALASAVDRDEVTAVKLTPSHLRALFADDRTPLPVGLLVLGGEALDAATVAAAVGHGVGRVVNHYGPTETTVGATTCDVTPLAAALAAVVPIGRPLPGVRTHVLDPRLRPVPWGVRGQLAIGGAGVSAGYVGAVSATAARFVDLPGIDGPAGRAYLTGDVVRLDDEGRLLFLGRDDDQVKIRGFRVELGEIASVLRAHEALVDAVAVIDPADAAGDRVLAYVVPVSGAPVPETDLVTWTRDRVPAYAVPHRVVTVPAIPLTASGKVDRRALPSVEEAAEQVVVVAPEGDVETRVHAIWSEVLDLDVLSVDDDFFLVGGHSLLATRITARARSEFGVELPLHLMFSHTTVRAYAVEVGARTVPPSAADTELADLLAALELMSDDEAAALLAEQSTDDRST